VNVADVNDIIETAIGGKEASLLYEGQKSFGILVRFPEAQFRDVEGIKKVRLETADGVRLPLGNWRTFTWRKGPSRSAAKMRNGES